MEAFALYLKSVLAILPYLKKNGLGIAMIFVTGSLGYGYLELLTKRAEITPEVMRAKGELAVSMARADAIRAKVFQATDTINSKSP